MAYIISVRCDCVCGCGRSTGWEKGRWRLAAAGGAMIGRPGHVHPTSYQGLQAVSIDEAGGPIVTRCAVRDEETGPPPTCLTTC